MTDTVPVRKGEELDLRALGEYLKGKINGAAERIELEQFPSGHSNLTYLLRIAGREYVLRRPPLGPVAPKAHDMQREYQVLSRLHPLYPPAPRTYLLCPGTSVLGAPFFLMERRRGVILRDQVPPAYARRPENARSISETLVEGLVGLHRIDIRETGLIDLGKPEGFLDRQIRGWAGRWDRAKTHDLPGINRAIGYLRDTLPEPLPPTMVHNDYKLDNVMLHPEDPSRLIAVLDWEMATVGDPLVDVGLSLVYWQQIGTLAHERTELGAPGAAAGWYTREQFLERYGERSGRDLTHITWYEILGIFKLAVILQQIHHRYLRGQTQDHRFRDFDQRVAALARVASERIP